MSSAGTPGDPAMGPRADVDVLASAVLAVPGVHGLHAGAHGEVATYLPGRRVDGVRVHDSGCDLHVVLDYGVALVATAELVRQAARPLVTGAVDVTVEDVAAPDPARAPTS